MNWCFQLVTIVTCVLTGLVTDLFNIVPACVCVCVCVCVCFVLCFSNNEKAANTPCSHATATNTHAQYNDLASFNLSWRPRA